MGKGAGRVHDQDSGGCTGSIGFARFCGRQVAILVSVVEVACGGKAANLHRLAMFGFRVPEAMVVPADDYRQFIEQNALHDVVSNIDQNVDGQQVRDLEIKAAVIRKSFESVPLPQDCEARIADWLQARRGTFAVRSSALHEDLPGASFAGQYDSYLNVVAEEVSRYVKQCFASLFNPRSIMYRRRMGIHGSGEMAVLIQEMVQSDFAGVIWTRTPRFSERLLIECTRGLGASVVSGTVRPSRYWIDRETREIVEAREINAFDRSRLRRLVDQALGIESRFGKPQDIEFSVAADEIYVLQTRPIEQFS